MPRTDMRKRRGKHGPSARSVFQGRHGVCYVPQMRRACGLLFVALAGCPKPTNDDPPIPWKPPPEPAWGDVPKTDADARALATKESTPNKLRRADAMTLLALHADASRLVAGEAAIAWTYDMWMNAESTPAYLIFGTMHDSRAQLETAAAIVFRMKAPWGFALEQFRAPGQWRGGPAPSADDADLAALSKGPLDEPALWRINDRQARFDHAAWKFGYLSAFTSLVQEARGAGMPLFGCDMPPELRASLTPGGEGERGAARDPLRSRAPFGRADGRARARDDRRGAHRRRSDAARALRRARGREPSPSPMGYLGTSGKKARCHGRARPRRSPEGRGGRRSGSRGAHRRDRSRARAAEKTARPTCCFSRTSIVGRLDGSREGSTARRSRSRGRTCRDRT